MITLTINSKCAFSVGEVLPVDIREMVKNSSEYIPDYAIFVGHHCVYRGNMHPRNIQELRQQMLDMKKNDYQEFRKRGLYPVNYWEPPPNQQREQNEN